MGVFEFGDPVEETDSVLGRVIRSSEYAIHVQCAFRLARNGSVVLGSDDHRRSKGSGDDPETMFDLRAEAIDRSLANTPHVVVEEIAVAPIGDLTLRLSRGLEIDVFVNSSSPAEQWRFLRRLGEHVVFPASAGREHE